MWQTPSAQPWLHFTPAAFELKVVEYLHSLDHRLKRLQVSRPTPGPWSDGEFDIEAVATFDAPGADLVVLVECKHRQHPIGRDLVRALADKLAASRTPHGMLCSTAPFDKAAVECGRLEGIALLHFTEDRPTVAVRSVFPEAVREAHHPSLVTLTAAGGMRYREDAFDEVQALIFGASPPA